MHEATAPYYRQGMSGKGGIYDGFVSDIKFSEQDILDSSPLTFVRGIISRVRYMKITILIKTPWWSGKKKRLVNIK